MTTVYFRRAVAKAKAALALIEAQDDDLLEEASEALLSASFALYEHQTRRFKCVVCATWVFTENPVGNSNTTGLCDRCAKKMESAHEQA